MGHFRVGLLQLERLARLLQHLLGLPREEYGLGFHARLEIRIQQIAQLELVVGVQTRRHFDALR
ncbi:MAG: hypothetical protein ACT4PG_11780 [Panacagrimonas sp.]